MGTYIKMEHVDGKLDLSVNGSVGDIIGLMANFVVSFAEQATEETGMEFTPNMLHHLLGEAVKEVLEMKENFESDLEPVNLKSFTSILKEFKEYLEEM